MARTILATAAALLALPSALAGIGYSTVRLNPCGTSTAVLPFQQWTYNNGNIAVANYELWGTHASWATVAGGESVNDTIWATPGGNGQYTMKADGSSTTISTRQSNFCVTVLGPAMPAAGLWLQPCVGSPSQLFTYNSASQTLVHTASGLCVDSGSVLPPCRPGSPGASLPFCNVSLPISLRVADIVSRLSVEEKQNMLDTSSAGSPSLGIGAINWWNEALHGIANNVGVAFTPPIQYSTSFPMAITSSCSFNASLWHAIGAAISEEGRAFANQGHSGLTFWSPTINMFRDPRWGRGQETPGEDTLVSGAYAVQYVKGMQEGADPRYLKVSSCCKHFAAYSLELWNGTDRHHFNAVVDDADLVNYYLQPFQACIQEGRASGVMCSYNAVNGVPSCANEFLLTEVLRNTWNFNGYVTSDCGAVSDIPQNHHYTTSTDQTAAATLKAGMDIGCDGYLAGGSVITKALADGAITENDLDAAMTHLFTVRMRLGEFDPASNQPYTNIPPTVACSPENIALSQDAARQSIVLLSNPSRQLPLSRSAIKSVAVVGPLADNGYINGGPNYNGVPCGGSASTVRTAFENAQPAVTVNYAQGCSSVSCPDNSQFAQAVTAASQSDATVVVVGIDADYENEGLDRVDINLPGMQNALVQQVCAAAAAKSAPCILVVVSGGAQDISDILGDVSAAFYVGLPGGRGADALVTLIFGDSSPAGRMTQTTYPNHFTTDVSLFDMGMTPGPSPWPPGTNPGRTYMWYTGTPVFPFGWGLSYTTWDVEDLSGPSTVSLEGVKGYLAQAPEHSGAFAPLSSPLVATHSVNVTNTGIMDADYVVLGFLEPPGAGTNGVPLQQLYAFDRVHVPAGQTVTVWLGLHARDLTRAVHAPDVDRVSPLAPAVRRVAIPGAYTIRVGVKAGGQEWVQAPLLVTE